MTVRVPKGRTGARRKIKSQKYVITTIDTFQLFLNNNTLWRVSIVGTVVRAIP